MKDVERAAEIRGKTIRFVWTEGPTRGKPRLECEDRHPVSGTFQVVT